ncbi:MAG: calcium/sodium antiporter [Candidatus Woykebacteria bacterium]
MTTFIFFLLGLAILIKGADYLVDGASSVSLKLKISPLVIGLTVVAFGTSAPELVVSVLSALRGSTQLALGNAVGSNIFNILVVLGLAAIVYPLTVQKSTVWKEIPMSFLAAVVLTVLGVQVLLDEKAFSPLLKALNSPEIIGGITLSNGLILLFFFIIFLYYTFGMAKENADEESTIKEASIPKSVFWIFLGLIGLALGSGLAVENAVTIAKNLGVSESLIGLTLLAVGTSLPELFTSISAALKKNTDIAVGNVVGSNIFNIMLVLGITSLIHPIPLSGQNLVDILVLFGATLLLFAALFVIGKHKITRVEGALMFTSYLAYLGFLIYRG